MAKPRHNKQGQARKKVAKTHKERNERRRTAVTHRTDGQFKDIPPGQRQRLLNNFERAKWRS